MFFHCFDSVLQHVGFGIKTITTWVKVLTLSFKSESSHPYWVNSVGLIALFIHSVPIFGQCSKTMDLNRAKTTKRLFRAQQRNVLDR